VLLVTVDTLRPDHLGLYGYERPTSPELDRWLDDAAVFERAYATEANTPPSIVSVLSGLQPYQHRVRLFYQLVPDATRLLPELLPPAYVSAAFVANVVLSDDALGIASRFDHYDDRVDEMATRGMDGRPIWERRASRTTDAALRWLRQASDPDRPLFLWVHYIDPHSPYAAPDPPRRFDHAEPLLVSADRLRLRPKGNGKVDALDRVDAYDEEIAYADAEIGRLLEGFAASRPIDDALLVFTADHGESMMEHEVWFAHGYHVYEEIIRVPLALRGPGVTPGRFAVPVSGVDVVPTILAFAGVETQGALRGADLRRPAAIPPDRTILAEATSISNLFGHWRTAIRGSSKWMAGTRYGDREVVHRIYYDLETDSAELQPEPWPAQMGGALALLELAGADPDPGGVPENARRGGAPKVSPRATHEQLEKLRALGYVEGD
jgi:arylsulfatase